MSQATNPPHCGFREQSKLDLVPIVLKSTTAFVWVRGTDRERTVSFSRNAFIIPALSLLGLWRHSQGYLQERGMYERFFAMIEIRDARC